MVASIIHQFVSQKTDGADATLVRPSNWNASHAVSGIVLINASGYINTSDLGTGTVSSNVSLYGNGSWKDPIPIRTYFSIGNECPMMGTMGTMTPSLHSNGVVRLFKFDMEAQMTVNMIHMKTNAITSSSLMAGLFNNSGNAVITTRSGFGTISGGWINLSSGATGLPYNMLPGSYWFGTTNLSQSSAVNAYTVCPGFGGVQPNNPWMMSTFYGTHPCTSGIMPSFVSTSQIIPHVSGYMIYTVLMT